MEIRFSNVLKIAADFECFNCTQGHKCQDKKMLALKGALSKLCDLAKDSNFSSPELSLLIMNLQANRHCSITSQPVN